MTELAQIDPFHAMEITRIAHAMKAEGRSVIQMQYGQPSTGAPAKAVEAVKAALDAGHHGYWESAPLKARLARHYLDAYGLEIDPHRFVLTCGASPALVLSLSSTFAPGDRIAMARPGYVAYRNTLKALHLVPVEVPCGPEVRYQLTDTALAALDPAPAGVIIASPANPTGTIIPKEEMAEIARVCRARGIRIISDEIYHGLSYEGPTHSILEFDPSAQVISSFSKYFSMPGWRMGWLLASEDQIERARAFMSNMFLTAPELSQIAALAAFDARDELEGHLQTYARNRALLLDALPRMGLREIAPPDGAFYIYADIGHLTDDSLGFCKDLLRDTGVAATSGVDFDPVDGHQFIRFSFAVSTPEVEEAIRRLEGWLAARNEFRASA